MLSKLRVTIEHINRELKIFRICKETYRGKGERSLIRIRIIASLFNHRAFFSSGTDLIKKANDSA